MPSETITCLKCMLNGLEGLANRLKVLASMQNLLKWFVLACTIAIALDDFHTYANVKKINKFDKNPDQIKIELAGILLTTKGHNNPSIRKQYSIVLWSSLGLVFLEANCLPEGYLSQIVSIIAIGIAVFSKHNCNRKYSELNTFASDKTEPSETSRIEQDEVPLSNINNHFKIVLNEYKTEKSNAQSIENHTRIALILICGICILAFNQTNFDDIFSLFFCPMTFIIFLRITSGIGVYVGFTFAIYLIIKTLNIKRNNNINAINFDENVLVQYTKDIRDANEKRTKILKKSLYVLVATLAAIIAYITLTWIQI